MNSLQLTGKQARYFWIVFFSPFMKSLTDITFPIIFESP